MHFNAHAQKSLKEPLGHGQASAACCTAQCTLSTSEREMGTCLPEPEAAEGAKSLGKKTTGLPISYIHILRSSCPPESQFYVAKASLSAVGLKVIDKAQPQALGLRETTAPTGGVNDFFRSEVSSQIAANLKCLPSSILWQGHQHCPEASPRAGGHLQWNAPHTSWRTTVRTSKAGSGKINPQHGDR